MFLRTFSLFLLIAIGHILPDAAHLKAAEDAPPAKFARWLLPQRWERDTEGPVIELGSEGDFDDTHIFAPCVMCEEGEYRLWYSGSRGVVAERVFRLGLATSQDGRTFEKSPRNPVFDFGDGEHSLLTPTLLRATDGKPIRENGRLRMWFSATAFTKGPAHNLHETSSADGITWEAPSAAQLSGLYAPSILKVGDEYQMWYTDVSAEPWCFRHAASQDGKRWQVTPQPVLNVEQSWEQGRLFYPTVVKSGEFYLMWYGSYWAQEKNKTAIGFAVSDDGATWHRHPQNPVFRPDPSRAWESHYTTSQSVMQLPDGSWRMWYASRKKPPFRNKYFAIGTARWKVNHE